MGKIEMDMTGTSRLVSFRRLVFEAIPEICIFQLLSGIVLLGLVLFLEWLIKLVAEAGGKAFTTSNILEYVLSWRGPVLLLLVMLLVAVYVIFEIFANILMCDDILCGRKVRLRDEIGKAIRSMRKFFNPAGIGILIYIFLAVPLAGIGFSISLSKNYRLPNFIMSFIRSKPLIHAGYIAGILVLAYLGLRWIFSLHEVLIDDITPAEAKKTSAKILKEHWKHFIPLMLITAVVLVLINIGFGLLLKLPEMRLEAVAGRFPNRYYVDIHAIMNGTATDLDYQVAGYRFICIFVVMGGAYLMSILAMLSGSYFLLRFTRCYREYTREEPGQWQGRSKRYRLVLSILILAGSLVGLFFLSLLSGILFNKVVEREKPVQIVAHRAGGSMAPENSLEGLADAITHGCYGSETDAQRTSDGHYIINHDNDFSRLCGVSKAPGDLTLKEIRGLTITDPTTGETAPVPTVEEMLDTIKGRVKLFLELKGPSADRQMADDLVKLIKEKDCLEDVALMSLNSEVIDYIETTYPEFETGVVLFGGIGDISRLNCDILIMEEDMASDARIGQIHDSGKQAIVWTVNTEDDMYRFLDSECDAVITDEVELAQQVQELLDKRSDLQMIRDRFENIFTD